MVSLVVFFGIQTHMSSWNGRKTGDSGNGKLDRSKRFKAIVHGCQVEIKLKYENQIPLPDQPSKKNSSWTDLFEVSYLKKRLSDI